jgi:serine/threonine protein kinase
MSTELKRLNDQYQLVRKIGRGGMGEVWAGSRSGPGGMWMTCAIKLLHRELAETPRDVEMFLNEARIASQLDHSRIVKVIDVGTDDEGTPFMVMEWVDGVNLRAFTSEAQKQNIWPLDIDITTYVVGEVLAALEYAHDRTIGGMDAGVIHSDVTPGNIMISSSGEVKLTDFGIARFAATAGPLSRSIGTPRYMSPEQLTGHPCRETDIYALGVVLHELLDGRRYLEGYPQDQFHAQVLFGTAPELVRPGVPAWLDDLRRRMLANKPEQRPSARGVRTVLVDNCPRYMAAADQIKNRVYPRLIGRKRSGMTELLDVGAIEAAIRHKMLGATPRSGMAASTVTGGRSPDPEEALVTDIDPRPSASEPGDVPMQMRRPSSPGAHTRGDSASPSDVARAPTTAPLTVTSDRAEASRVSATHDAPVEPTGPIEPTEQLPDSEIRRLLRLPSETASPVAAAGGELDAPSGEVRLPPPVTVPRAAAPARNWLWVGALVSIVALALVSISLFVELRRVGDAPRIETTPRTDAEVASLTSTTSPAAVAEPIATPQVPASTEVVTEAADASETGTETETGSETSSTTQREGEATTPDGSEQPPPSEPADQSPTVEPLEPVKSNKPKPKPAQVGVVFVVDADVARVKVGRTSHALKNGSVYVAVDAGKTYELKIQRASTTDWHTIGKLQAKAIAPRGYVVKYAKGTFSIDERDKVTR